MADNAIATTFTEKERRKMLRELDDERGQLIQAVAKTRQQLTMARMYFDTVTDTELIEESVYEINALQARYSYLFRKLREIEQQIRADKGVGQYEKSP